MPQMCPFQVSVEKCHPLQKEDDLEQGQADARPGKGGEEGKIGQKEERNRNTKHAN